MCARWPSAAFLLIATTSAPLAAPASLDGAHAIERGYVDYFGKAAIDKGVVSVAPDGDDYLVSWDLQKALDLVGSPAGALRIGRFSYRLIPAGEGAWTATADRFPSLAFDVPTDKGKMTGTLDFAGSHGARRDRDSFRRCARMAQCSAELTKPFANPVPVRGILGG